MDYRSLILEGDMERNSATRLNTAFKILEQETFNNLCQNEPFVAQLMINKFKEFLDDDYFDDIERQIILLKFLECCYPLEIITDVLDFIQNDCALKEDYSKVILEWNLQYDDYIKSNILQKYDGEELTYTIEEKQRYDKAINNLNKIGIKKLEKLLENVGIKLELEDDGKKEN